MSDDKKYEHQLEQITALHSILDKQESNLNLIIHALAYPESTNFFDKLNTPDNKDWFSALHYLIRAACASTNSLKTLTINITPTLRDSFGVGRTIVETIINAIFILASDKSEANKAVRHYQQKVIRDLNRKKKYGDAEIIFTFGTEHDAGEIPAFKELIDEFTSKKGNELNWPGIPIVNRLELIRKKYGRKVFSGLSLAHFFVYSHASEILHGSLYGVMFSYGLAIPRYNDQPDHDNLSLVLGHVLTLVLCVNMSFVALFKSIDKELDFDVLGKVADDYIQEIKEIMLGRD